MRRASPSQHHTHEPGRERKKWITKQSNHAHICIWLWPGDSVPSFLILRSFPHHYYRSWWVSFVVNFNEINVMKRQQEWKHGLLIKIGSRTPPPRLTTISKSSSSAVHSLIPFHSRFSLKWEWNKRRTVDDLDLVVPHSFSFVLFQWSERRERKREKNKGKEMRVVFCSLCLFHASSLRSFIVKRQSKRKHNKTQHSFLASRWFVC